MRFPQGSGLTNRRSLTPEILDGMLGPMPSRLGRRAEYSPQRSFIILVIDITHDFFKNILKRDNP
jgi:hypothetical protein